MPKASKPALLRAAVNPAVPAQSSKVIIDEKGSLVVDDEASKGARIVLAVAPILMVFGIGTEKQACSPVDNKALCFRFELSVGVFESKFSWVDTMREFHLGSLTFFGTVVVAVLNSATTGKCLASVCSCASIKIGIALSVLSLAAPAAST